MSYVFHPSENGHAPIKSWTKGVPMDEKSLRQLKNLASMPFIHKHVAAMPDVHWGMGATVGSVFGTKKAIIPAAVGVDIGCGMCAALTDLTAVDLPDNLKGIRSAIEKHVPHGRTDNGGENDRGAWSDTPASYVNAFTAGLSTGLAEIVAKHPKLERSAKRALRHIGTLGTGNHFIEVCLDKEDRVWVMLHSGSRGIGNAIGSYFIDRAKEEMERWHIKLPDADLAYLPEGHPLFDDYVQAVGWAQDYAKLNREMMLSATLQSMRIVLGREFRADLMAINCHHNYVERENHFGENVWLTRKGAVRARKGDLGIIPGSMGARSFIVRGKGNPESFCSCSHGAGRLLSRGEAKRKITLEDHIEATKGIECRKDADVIDESPAAYKNIQQVMDAQADLVEIVAELRQVVCVKG